MPGLRALAVAIILLPMPCLADVTATYAVGDSGAVMTIEIASNGNIRGDAQNPTSYSIIRDGQPYLILPKPHGAEVVRLEDMATAMDELVASLTPPGTPPTPASPDVPLRPGGTVMVGGRSGTAYYAAGDADHPRSGEPILVISHDPALAPLGAAMARQYAIMAAHMIAPPGTAQRTRSMLAALRTGTPLLVDGMQLKTVSFAPVPAAQFDLPAPPDTIAQVRAAMRVPAH